MSKSFYSTTLNWLLRITIFLIVLIGICLFMLTTLSGTSDSHRQGLEQAFSQAANEPIEITELKKFFIFPQFRVETGFIQSLRPSGNAPAFSLQSLTLGFGFYDILFRTKKIQDFQIENLRLASGHADIPDMNFPKIGIQVETKNPQNAFFEIEGSQGDQKIEFQLPLQFSWDRLSQKPEFSVADQQEFKAKYGSTHFKGILQILNNEKNFTDVVVQQNGRDLLRLSGLVRFGGTKLDIEDPENANPASLKFGKNILHITLKNSSFAGYQNLKDLINKWGALWVDQNTILHYTIQSTEQAGVFLFDGNQWKNIEWNLKNPVCKLRNTQKQKFVSIIWSLQSYPEANFDIQKFNDPQRNQLQNLVPQSCLVKIN
jgi:hypothetical protein